MFKILSTITSVAVSLVLIGLTYVTSYVDHRRTILSKLNDLKDKLTTMIVRLVSYAAVIKDALVLTVVGLYIVGFFIYLCPYLFVNYLPSNLFVTIGVKETVNSVKVRRVRPPLPPLDLVCTDRVCCGRDDVPEIRYPPRWDTQFISDKIKDGNRTHAVVMGSGVTIVRLNNDTCILDRDHCKVMDSYIWDDLIRTVKLYSFIRYYKNTTTYMHNHVSVTPSINYVRDYHTLNRPPADEMGWMYYMWERTQEVYFDAFQFKQIDTLKDQEKLLHDFLDQAAGTVIAHVGRDLFNSTDMIQLVLTMLDRRKYHILEQTHQFFNQICTL